MTPEDVQNIKSKIRVEPSELTFDEFVNFIPRPIELKDGYPTDGYLMLIALIKCYGLKKVISLFPREAWEQAINQIYS